MAATPLPPDVNTSPGELDGVPTLDITVGTGEPGAVLFWLHGGFYVFGSPAASASLSSSIARRGGTRAVSVASTRTKARPTDPAAPTIAALQRPQTRPQVAAHISILIK
jgi:monoterpene epsilon-lactone hydrolase